MIIQPAIRESLLPNELEKCEPTASGPGGEGGGFTYYLRFMCIVQSV